MVNGRFLAEDSTVPDGQTIVAKLLDRCVVWSDIVLARCVFHKSLNWNSEVLTRLISP